MQQNRLKYLWIVAIAVAFFFFIDPFRLFTGRRMPVARVDEETRIELAEFLANSPSAREQVLDLFDTADLVLIGETGYARQHVEFAADLIPVLQSAGIHHLGYQYALIEDQDEIDRLVTAPTFDEEVARRVLFNNLSVFGFQEHVDIFRAAWQVNRQRISSEPPFRIVALGNRLDYSAITSQDDVEDPEVMQRVFATGVPDQVMAEVMAEQFLDAGLKAAAFLQMDHAHTRFRRSGYEQELADLGFRDMQRAGNALYAEYGSRVVSAALHGPVRHARSPRGFAYPTAGIIETAAEALPDGRTAGFRTGQSPFADVAIVSDALARDSEGELTLKEYADAWLIVAPVKALSAVTPIEDFITDRNVAEAIRTFPGASPQDATVEDMNEFIVRNAEGMAEVFEEFR